MVAEDQDSGPDRRNGQPVVFHHDAPGASTSACPAAGTSAGHDGGGSGGDGGCGGRGYGGSEGGRGGRGAAAGLNDDEGAVASGVDSGRLLLGRRAAARACTGNVACEAADALPEARQ